MPIHTNPVAHTNAGGHHDKQGTPSDARMSPSVHVDLSGDAALAHIRASQAQSGESPATTPRRPDLRGIVLNDTGAEVSFMNPGGHASKVEIIPHGQSFMIMFKGSTFEEQVSNASELFRRYNLYHGVSETFLAALKQGDLSQWVAECYGPAPFEKQSGQLTHLTWMDADGIRTEIHPVKGPGGAFGVRAPSMEEVYKLVLAPGISTATLRGTTTNSENFTGGCYYMAVNEDWQTKAVTTKPIAPEVANGFYGEHVVDIPTYEVAADGTVALVARP